MRAAAGAFVLVGVVGCSDSLPSEYGADWMHYSDSSNPETACEFASPDVFVGAGAIVENNSSQGFELQLLSRAEVVYSCWVEDRASMRFDCADQHTLENLNAASRPVLRRMSGRFLAPDHVSLSHEVELESCETGSCGSDARAAGCITSWVTEHERSSEP